MHLLVSVYPLEVLTGDKVGGTITQNLLTMR